MTEQDKKIKELLKGNFDEQTPSFNFTEQIMDKIEAQENSEVQYVPVISKMGWIAIAASFLLLLFLGSKGEGKSKLDIMNYVPQWNVDFSFVNSPLTMIAVLSIFAMLIIDRLFLRFKMMD